MTVPLYSGSLSYATLDTPRDDRAATRETGTDEMIVAVGDAHADDASGI